ncbi:unnamed protein product [Pedinophyceae sp. YPF-701]|nr:unnamed protein product [Pedinophyceae sp. YPF-701]
MKCLVPRVGPLTLPSRGSAAHRPHTNGPGGPWPGASYPSRRSSVRLRASEEEDEASKGPSTELARVIQRKSKEVQDLLEELGMEKLDEELANLPVDESAAPFPLSMTVSNVIELEQRGGPALIVEVRRTGPTPEDVATAVRDMATAGADAVAVPTDLEDTPDGLADLEAACVAAREVEPRLGRKVPVLMKDWILHPYQLIQAKKVGAGGGIGLVTQVSGARGTAVVSAFAARMGMDCPVEVVNLQETEAMIEAGVALFAFSTSIGLSVSLPGFKEQVASSLIGKLPHGCLSLMSARDVQEAVAAREAGADMVLLRWELFEGCDLAASREIISAIKMATSGDD